MIRWKVKFRSLRTNTLYTVNIYDDQYNGVPATLLGGAQPFYTEEDNDRDWFMPVRTQTGYLNIVDTGKDLEGNDFDWMDMIPETAKSRPVTLTDENGTILWQGYLQPQTFSGRLYEPTQERSFPVMCPLSALGSIDVSVSNNGVVTFARLLSDIIYATGGQWDWVNFQSLDSVEWLMKKVDWANFVESDSAGNRSAKYDLLTLLEEICRFWGWTCRWQGRQLWFVCPDDEMVPDYIAIEPSELYDSIDAGIVPQYQEGEWQTVSTDSDIYASVDNNVEVMLGIRKASVSADINKMTVVTELPYDKIMDMYRNNPVQTIHEGDVYVFYLHQFSDGPAEYTFDDLHIDINSFSTPSYNGYGAFIISDGYEGDISLKHSYDWKVSLGIVGTLVGTPYASEWIYMMESLYPHNYDHGVLAISAGVDHGGVLTCRLRVGSKWWNGTAWGSTKTTFTVQVGDETDPTSGNAGKIISNRVLNSSHGEYDGYGVYVETGIGGRVRFEIVGFEPNDTTIMVLNITALKIEFVRDKAYSLYDHDRAENVYKAVTGKEFSDETEISTIFASDNLNAFGLGIIQNYDGTYCKQVRYSYQDGNELSRPEQHLLDRIISRGKSTGLIEHVYIRSNLLDINPYTFCQTKQMTGYPIAINRQWRDDVTEAYILQSSDNIPHPLPYDAQVEYLESTGTQYIDTLVNINAAADFEIEVWFMFTTDTSYEAVFGAVGNSPRPGLRLYRNNVTGTDLQSGSTIRINTTTAKDQLYKFRVKVNNGEMEYQLNDGQWLTSTCDTSYNGNILVFASMVAGAVNGLAKIRLMKYRYTGGLLNQDMIPVRKNQTGYLFDSVSSQLFGNAGTDSFVVGNDVVNP